MRLLLGIPTHKRPDLLRQCLGSIAVQEGALPEIEVFVADNDPKGMAGARLAVEVAGDFRFPLTSTIVEEPGISAVRNAILDEARRRDADYIAMIDDDVRAETNWLSRLWARAAATGADVLAGPVFYDLPDGTSESVRTAFSSEIPPSGPIELINGTTGVLISTQRLKESDWPRFDPAFGLTGGGDKEWFSRLKGLGARFEWVADAHVVETVPPSRANLKWLLRRKYRYGIDDMRIDQLHGTAASRRALLVQALGLMVLTPVVLPLLLTGRRYVWLGRFARVWGRLSALFGRNYQEYALRHANDAPGSISDPQEAS